MSRREESQRRVEEEIRREKAAALGRAGGRLEDALAHAKAIARRFEAARNPSERERLARDYEAARVRVERARLALVVQREAIGLRHHAVIDQAFPEPPRRLR
jgi:hypothetical protein